MQNEDSQNEKTPTAKHHKKVPKTSEFVYTDSDDTDDEQGPASKQPKKPSKTPEFVDTDSDDEEKPTAKQPQKASKVSEFVDKGMDDEQGPAVKCMVMYSTEDEQEPTVKQPQKTSKISGDEDPQETSPAKIPNFAAASCTHILTKGVKKSKQCRFRASDKAGKFCRHHKQTPN